MDNDLLPEQRENLKTWAEQRDEALAKVAMARSELENLTKMNATLSASNSDLQTRANTLVASIAEMIKEKAELTRDLNIFKTNVLSEKASLKADNESVVNENKLLTEQKNLLVETIKVLTDTHDRVYKRVGVLDKVVDHVVRISEKNIATLDAFISNLKKTNV